MITGPGHGAPAVHANLRLEGTHADHDPALSRDGSGLRELVRRFSWPGGFPSHLAPEVPGVIHEGGELGYALATAVGAALDDPDLLELLPDGDLRLGAVPQANGGALRADLPLPPLEPSAVEVSRPGGAQADPTPVLGEWLTALMRATEARRDFRIFCPDELASNLLAGRHGLFPCYEAFASIVDSMVNQYAKFLHQEGELVADFPAARRKHAAGDDARMPGLDRPDQPRGGR
ncbi:MAG: hypothetical protein ACRDRP_12330 [Pseudonocardiaceae bacterium]